MERTTPIRATFYSIVPSPYQRDLFQALSQLPEIDLTVHYLEPASPDSPWPQKALQPYESILPGTYLSWGLSRFHVNWHLPNLRETDVVVLNGYQSLTSQIILHYATKQIPCIFWGEKMQASSGGVKGSIQKVMAKGLQQCSAIAAIGTRAVEDYQKRFPGKPIFNIPYYCDLSQFAVNLPQRPRSPVTILLCGQMIARKGVDLLLEAFDRLIQSGLEARLLLVGREAELPQMMATLSPNTQNQIEYAGFQAPEALPEYFRQADLFVLPSRYDGWGVVVNQALGAGLPIICSDAVGAAQDLVEPGVNGFIFENGSVDGIFQALTHYLQHPERIEAASQASLQKANAWYPEVGAKRWLEVFEKFTDQGRQFRRKD